MRTAWLRRPAPVDGAARLHALVAPPPDRPDAAAADGPPVYAPTWRDALLDPARRGVLTLAAAGLLATAVAGIVFLRARPAAEPVEIGPPAATGPPAAAVLVVDVAGAVRRPGLVRLPAGARVADAIGAAGGTLPGASTAGLNLARKVADGEQVLVAGPGVPVPAGAGAAAPGRLDLNLATEDQLDALPGIGPVLARRIVAWRAEHGRFASVEQLREVPGIGERTYADLKALVTV